jgi:hypothetical protein
MQIIPNHKPLSLAETIGSMLTALVDAQAASARATVDFITEVGFLPVRNGKPSELRQVSFQFQKKDENDKRSAFEMQVPLLSLVPIPNVAVKKASIRFDWTITSTPEDKQNPRSQSGNQKRILIKGLVTPNSRDTAKLNIAIEIEQAPMPIGVDRTLDILQLAAVERKL